MLYSATWTNLLHISQGMEMLSEGNFEMSVTVQWAQYRKIHRHNLEPASGSWQNHPMPQIQPMNMRKRQAIPPDQELYYNHILHTSTLLRPNGRHPQICTSDTLENCRKGGWLIPRPLSLPYSASLSPNPEQMMYVQHVKNPKKNLWSSNNFHDMNLQPGSWYTPLVLSLASQPKWPWPYIFMTKAYLDAHQSNQKSRVPLPEIDIFDSYHTRHGTMPPESDSHPFTVETTKGSNKPMTPLHVYLLVVNKLPPPTSNTANSVMTHLTEPYTQGAVSSAHAKPSWLAGGLPSQPTTPSKLHDHRSPDFQNNILRTSKEDRMHPNQILSSCTLHI